MEYSEQLNQAPLEFEYVKTNFTTMNTVFENMLANYRSFVSLAASAGVSVKPFNVYLNVLENGITLCEKLIEDIREYVNNLKIVENNINVALGNLNVDLSGIDHGYASSMDSSTYTKLREGVINENSIIAGYSFDTGDNNYITWYGGNEYANSSEFLSDLKKKYPNIDIKKNLKVLIKTNDTPIAWIDYNNLFEGSTDNSSSASTTNASQNESVTEQAQNRYGNEDSISVSSNSTKSSGEVKSSNSPNGKYTQSHYYTYTKYDAQGFYYNSSPVGVASGTPQKEVNKLYNNDGARYNNGIAVLNVDGEDRYLVALSPKYGNVGDKVDIVMNDGETVKCVIADAKNPNDYNYVTDGHLFDDNTLNILEFEVNPNQTKSWSVDWNSNQDIVRIDNYGSII